MVKHRGHGQIVFQQNDVAVLLRQIAAEEDMINQPQMLLMLDNFLCAMRPGELLGDLVDSTAVIPNAASPIRP